MRGSATTIVFDGYTPVTARVTATRPDTPAEQTDTGGRRLHQLDTTLLAKLLAGTGISAEGWTVWSEPDERTIGETSVENAALAAILAAGGAIPAGAFRDDTIISDTWTSCTDPPGYQGRSHRGAASRARLAATLRQPLVAAGHQTARVLPRNNDLEYFIPTTTTNLIHLLRGQADLHRHSPNGAGDAARPRIPQDILETPTSTIKQLTQGVERAYRARRPLLLVQDHETQRLDIRYRARRASQVTALLLPPLGPDAQQSVLETHDLAGLDAPGADGPRIERPTRAPHWFTLAYTLRSIKRRRPAQTLERPGELDLAAHGVLLLNITPGTRLDRSASETVIEDWNARDTDRYQIVAIKDRQQVSSTRRPIAQHPLTTLPYETAPWNERPGDHTTDAREKAARAARNRATIEAARERIDGHTPVRRQNEEI